MEGVSGLTPPPASTRWRGRRRARPAPWWLLLTVAGVAVFLAVPLVSVAYQAIAAGWTTIHRVLSGPLLPTLLVHTVQLTVPYNEQRDSRHSGIPVRMLQQPLHLWCIGSVF